MSVDLNAYTEAMITQMALVQGTISTIGTLENSSPVVLAVLYEAVQNALTPFDQAIKALEADIDTTSVGGVVMGIAPTMMAAELLKQADDVEQEARIMVARAGLARAQANVNNAVG